MARVSIKSIASSLNVSAMTVSLVLNDKAEGRVSQAVIDKVKNYAAKVHYQPNYLARSLKDGRSRIIGLVVADISNTFFSQIALYVQQCAEQYGYNVLIANTNESDERLSQAISMLRSHQVDGFIIVPTVNSGMTLRELDEQKIPFVLMDRYFDDMSANYVVSDNYEASKRAVDRLTGLGLRDIVMVNYVSPMVNFRMRERGYCDAMCQASCSPRVVSINPDRLHEDMRQAMAAMVESMCHADAIYFATNMLSIEGLRCLKNLSQRPLSSYKILSFDKTDAFDLMDMKIAYIQQPIQEMSEVAVVTLLDTIANDDMPIKKVILESKIVM